jgi:hypothetical protein
VGHLTCVINHRDPSIRGYGVSALSRLCHIALSKRPDGAVVNAPPRPRTATVVGSGTINGESKVEPLQFQEMLLDPFADLSRSKYEDNRQSILQGNQHHACLSNF